MQGLFFDHPRPDSPIQRFVMVGRSEKGLCYVTTDAQAHCGLTQFNSGYPPPPF